MKTAVVIVTFNNAEILGDLLDDLGRQICLPDKVFVIDNASKDHTENIVKFKYPEVQYIRLDKNTGSAGGFYEGIKLAYSNFDFIYLLDDDSHLQKDTLKEILDCFLFLEQSASVKIGAVRSVGPSHSVKIPTPFEIFSWRGTLLKCKIVSEVGLPKAEYFLYGEDLEYSLRISNRGYNFFWCPRSICGLRSRIYDGKKSISFLGNKVTIYKEPFRLYYAFRNEISIYLNYNLKKVSKVFIYAAKLIIYNLLTEKDLGIKDNLAIIDGCKDGLAGHLGFNPKYHP